MDANTHPDLARAGFTLVELMVASIIGLLLLSVVYAIFIQTVSLSEVMLSQVTLNTNAREMFYMLQNGGNSFPAAAVNAVELPGMRGRNVITVDTYRVADPANPPNGRLARLELADLSGAGAPALANAEAPGVVPITCTGVRMPYLDCQNAGQQIVLTGYLAELTFPNPPNPNALNLFTDGIIPVVIPLRVINPAMAGRRQAVATGVNTDLFDTQTMVFRLREAQ